jgi:conjugal transfer mating pair stabilization protein TraN
MSLVKFSLLLIYLLLCAIPAHAAECRKIGSVCAEANQTRYINGQQIFRACWRYEDTYECVDPSTVNYCDAISKSSCYETSSACTSNAFNGECLEYTKTYRCGSSLDAVPTGVIQLDNTYTVTDKVNNSACTSLETNSKCVIAQQACAEPGGTRIIDGASVTRDCWKWEKTYSCYDGMTKTDDCSDLAADTTCALNSSSCVSIRNDGTCDSKEKVYSCQTRAESSTTETRCDVGSCVQGICSAASTPNDQDFKNAIIAMEVGREAGAYMDVDSMTVFNGVANACSKGVVNCCKEKVSASTANSVAMSASVQIAGETVKYFGSKYLYDTLYPMDNLAGNMVEAVVEEGSTFAVPEYNGPSFMGFSYDLASQTFAFDPYSFAFAVALMVAQKLLNCSPDEQTLSLKRGNNLCTYVGSYCSKKILGSCITTKQSYCCYNSKFAKIINEQGRPQLGKGYGAVSSPDCSGFTIEEIGKLDFSEIDFGELISDIEAKAFDTNSFSDRVGAGAKSRIENYFSNSGANANPLITVNPKGKYVAP